MRQGLIFPFLVISFLFSEFHHVNASDYTSVGQEAKNKINVISPSPTVAAMCQYGMTPVSYATGVPSISIPLFTLQCGELILPISLNYHAEGIKVDTSASWVGLGWSLDAGGSIGVTVNGAQDFGSFFGNEYRLPSFEQIMDDEVEFRTPFNSNSSTKMYDVVEDMYSKQNDNQYGDNRPDIFTYNVCGHSGQFILDAVPNSNVKKPYDLVGNKEIEFSIGGMTNYSFTAYDNLGTRYVFGLNAREKSQRQPEYPETNTPEQVTAWNVTAISKNKDTILFNYSEREEIEISQVVYPLYFGRGVPPTTYAWDYMSRPLGYIGGPREATSSEGSVSWTIPVAVLGKGENYGRSHTRYIRHKTQKLCEIRASNGIRIVLSSSATRQDMPTASNNQKAVLLSSISIYDYLGNKLKEWQFDYDYFISGIQSSFDVSASKRLFLKSLKELSSCDSIVNIYSFEYYGENGNEPQMPYRHSFAGKDVWGYFNGVVTTVQAEDPRNAFCEFSGIGFNKTYRYFDAANREITGSQNIPVSYTPLSVHNVNPQLVSTYSLKRITYPTGGHTTFEYEPNTFRTSDTYPYSIFAPSDTLAGGQRIKKITDYDGISTSVRTFCYSSGDLPEIPRFIEEKTYESFRTSLVGNSIGGSVIIYHGDLNNYLIFYPNPVNSTGISNADNVIYPEVIETLSDGTQTIYHFETLTGLSSNLTTRIFDLGRPCHGRYFEVYSTREDMNYKATTWGYVTDIDYIDFANLGSQDHLFNVGNHIKERPESFSNGYQGRFGTFFARGQLKEKTVRDADSMLVLKEEYTYTLKDLHVIPALDITNNLMPNVNSVLLPIMHSLWPNSPIPGNYTTMPEIYYLNFYFYLAGNSQLTSKRIIEYRSSGTDTIPIIRREDYTYNSYNLLSATSLSTISRTEVYHEAEGVVNEGDIVYWDEEAGLYYNETNDEYLYPAWTEIVDTPVDTYTRSARYPSDINTGVYADMVANHMLNYIIEQCEVINGSTISASLTEYSLQGNSYYPSAIYTYTPNEPNSSFQNFNGVAGSHYGSPYFLLSFFNGRLSSITDKAGVTTSYEWNRRYQYPTSETISGGNLTHNRLFTYSQRYGMTSETSATGYKLLYDYDNSGKLISISGKPTDFNIGYLLNQYQYHIANASLDSTSLGSNQITSMLLLDDTVHHAITTIDYFDGLGRKVQSIGNGLMPGDSYHTLLSRTEYDGNGREWRKYLPVSVIGFNYIETPSFKYDDNMALSEVAYDALDHTVSVKTPGSDMGQRSKKQFHWTNPDNSVKRYAVSSDGTLTQDGYYPAGILTMERAEDEDMHVTEVYTDYLGRKVLERRLLSNGTSGNNDTVDTYYVYNVCGNLCFVLQPMFQTEDDLEKYSFRYNYNSRGLMSEKIIPGCGAITYTYDNADRLLTMQDAEMRAQWLTRHYTYDGLSRVTKQTLRNYQITIQTEQRNYYDGDYQFITNGDATLNSVAQSILSYSGEKGTTSSTEPLWGRTFTSGTIQRASDGTDIVTALYYNSRGLVVEKNSKLLGSHLRREQFDYTFTGKVSRHTIIDYDGSREMLRSITTNNYDATTGKLISTGVTTIVDGHSETQQTSAYEYDSYGRVHGVTRGPTCQTWAYDVRDWPTKISSTHFTETLSYTGRYYNGSINSINYTDSCTFAYAYQFSYDSLNRLRNAEYSDNLLIYDGPTPPIQPLSSSTLMLVPSNGDSFGEGTPSTIQTVVDFGDPPLSQGLTPYIINKYGEEIEYDKNCNIARLKRYGAKDDRSYGLIDDLYISYYDNQRDTVRDERTNLSYTGSSEFVKKGSGTYSYNENGSLVSDENRGILSIEYDDLGNTRQITFTGSRSIEYVYSPDGEKLREIHSEPRFINPLFPGVSPPIINGYKRDTTDYIGNLILKNRHPKMLLFDGGYASFDHDTINGWHYYIKDYLGNNRMVVDGRADTVEQVTHYYPYGGVIGDISTNESLQKYKFEGKELDRTFGLDNYDIHARQYFAMAPMWDKPDSKAEDYYPISPYAYCGGDPVNLGDYDGKRVKPKGDESLSIILNTLPVEARQYIILDQEGYIDQETMKQYKGDSDNFSSLLALASDPIEITVTTLETIKYVMNGSEDTEYFTYIEGPTCPDDYDKDFKSCIGNTTGETGNLGVTYMPTNGGKGKADAVNPNSIHININPHLSSVGAAETFSHEGYGHAFIYVNTNGDRSRAIHHPVNDGTKTIETNQELFERSIKARKETIKNMGQ